jgi:hypothetical protein
LLPWGIPKKEGRIQLLTVLAPSMQTLGSLLKTPWPAWRSEKFDKKLSLLNFAIFYTYKCIFGVGILHCCLGAFQGRRVEYRY